MTTKTVQVPDDKDFERLGGITWWKTKHAYHFASDEHVSVSPFAEYHGSYDRGLKLHIPAAGAERDEMRAKEEKAEQRKRCHALRNPKATFASDTQ